MKIGELVPDAEVPELVVTLKAIQLYQKVDVRYNKYVLVREYYVEDETGSTRLTTFNKDLKKNVEDQLVIRRAWCKSDKFKGNVLTLGKWGFVQ